MCVSGLTPKTIMIISNLKKIVFMVDTKLFQRCSGEGMQQNMSYFL